MTMKFQAFVLFAAAFLLAGCPYESPVPIDPGKTNIDERMLGTWFDVKDSTRYVISKNDAATYLVESKVRDSSSSVEKYYAIHSSINGTIFLSVWEEKSNAAQRKYLLYKVEIKDDILKGSPLTEHIREKFSSSEDLRSFIEKNMHNSYFYEKTMDLRKQPGSPGGGR